MQPRENKQSVFGICPPLLASDNKAKAKATQRKSANRPSLSESSVLEGADNRKGGCISWDKATGLEEMQQHEPVGLFNSLSPSMFYSLLIEILATA